MTHPACQHISVTLQFPLSVYNHSNLSTLVMSNQDQMHLTMSQALCNSYEMDFDEKIWQQLCVSEGHASDG